MGSEEVFKVESSELQYDIVHDYFDEIITGHIE